jgi:NAD(P)-dependent dehydrogenase (short-subunit alcohol dehydrogenase family)
LPATIPRTKWGAELTVAEITRKSEGSGGARNVSGAGDVKRLFEETKRAVGKVDVLVNDRGVFQFEPFEAVTEMKFHRHSGAYRAFDPRRNIAGSAWASGTPCQRTT